MKHYLLTLSDGTQRKIDILKEFVYQIQFDGDASTHYQTQKYIYQNFKRIYISSYNPHDPFRLVCARVGYLRDEQAMFDVYRSLRTPIVELKLIEE